MSRPSRSWRRHEKDNAECGMRNAEYQWEHRSASDFPCTFRIPHSAFRTPGGEVGTVKYFVTIGAQTLEVEVDGNRVTVGGGGLEGQLAPVSGTPPFNLLLGAEPWTPAAQPLQEAGRWALGMVGVPVD